MADYLFKTVLVGESGVGKTNFRSRLCGDVMNDDSTYSTFRSTIGFEVRVRKIEVKAKKCKVQLWDTPGKVELLIPRFQSCVPTAFRGANGIFLLYDITDVTSFESISKWLNMIRKSTSESMILILLGNKCDLEDQRMVSREKGEAFAELHGLQFLEISTWDCTNVERALYDMVTSLLPVQCDQMLEQVQLMSMETWELLKCAKLRQRCVLQ